MLDSAASTRAPSTVGDFIVHENLSEFEADILESTALALPADPETLPPLDVAIIALFMKYTSTTDPMQLLSLYSFVLPLHQKDGGERCSGSSNTDSSNIATPYGKLPLVVLV